jgi:hypothetical protein
MVVSKIEDEGQMHSMEQIERCCIRIGFRVCAGIVGGLDPRVPSCSLAFTVLFLASRSGRWGLAGSMGAAGDTETGTSYRNGYNGGTRYNG